MLLLAAEILPEGAGWAYELKLDLFLVFRRPLGGVARAILPAACFQQALVGNEEADECRLPAKIAPHKDGLRKS